MTLTFQGHVT